MVKHLRGLPTLDGLVKERAGGVDVADKRADNAYVLGLWKTEPHPRALHREDRLAKLRRPAKLLRQFVANGEESLVRDRPPVVEFTRHDHVVPRAMDGHPCLASECFRRAAASQRFRSFATSFQSFRL